MTSLKQLLDAFRCTVHMNDAEQDVEEAESKGKPKAAKGKVCKYMFEEGNK